jgi:hypothetical protein
LTATISVLIYHLNGNRWGDMTQHFLLSAKARTLSLSAVARLSDEEAPETFKAIRWASSDGKPFCPKCGSLAPYARKAKPLWECRGCGHVFSVTSGTLFASRKLPIRDYLLAIAIFVNGAKGHSALQLSRDLGVQYKTAFVLAHKSADYRRQTGSLCAWSSSGGRPACDTGGRRGRCGAFLARRVLDCGRLFGRQSIHSMGHQIFGPNI